MRTNIEILESLNVDHKKLKEEKPYLLFKILKAMDIARTEQLTIPDVVKSLKGVDKIPLIEWREKTFREIGTNRFELRTNTALVYGIDEISKMYDSF